MKPSAKRFHGLKRRSVDLLIAAVVVLFCVSAVEAVDPVPDWKTLIMPSLVPKAGHENVPPADALPGAIRNAYDSTYEEY